MVAFCSFRTIPKRHALAAGSLACLAIAAIGASLTAADQPSETEVGVIDGDSVAVSGLVKVETVGGRLKTILRSGSDVRVRDGQARINLVEGGQIAVCGPAHFSVLKSGGSLTIALDSGVIHARLEQTPSLTVYTPQIQAKPVAIGDDARDLLVGFESPGVMCLRTYRGALRIEQQLSGQSIVVPQGGDVLLMNGEIDSLKNGQGHCQCDLQIADATPPPPLPTLAPPPSPSAAPSPAPPANAKSSQTETAQVAVPFTEGGSAPPAEKPRPTEQPIYHVEMPPLVYDAGARVQPEPDPQLMVVVRRVHVRPTLIFQGRVETPAKPAADPAPPPAAAANPPAAQQAPPKPPTPAPSFFERVKAFFRNLWTPGS